MKHMNKDAFKKIIFGIAALTKVSCMVQELTTSDSIRSALNQNDLVLVKFYAPWCGYCKKFKEPYEDVGEGCLGKALVTEVNCDQHAETCEEFGVKGYPAVKIFTKQDYNQDPANYKGMSYDGPRETADVINFVNNVNDGLN
eukprot:GHVP01024341.1.p1 GENE.GHVP01024341.1~~GHVP01024341.1.p1  ORF type:complete len:142 (+),score=21.23 GHVP01024341.1:160-585(+)